MTRYAKPVIGKKQAEEASSWSALKQTVVGTEQEKVKRKKKKLKKIKENVDSVVSHGIAVEKISSQGINSVLSEDIVVKKLKKKKKSKQKVVEDAIKLESKPKFDQTHNSQSQGKLGKGKRKFSMIDPETKRKQRAEVHRNRRAAKDPCFVCRSRRHKATNCPKGDGKGIGMCFKCASTEHTSSTCPRRDIQGFPHAKCFICNETGHLSRACPDNPRGLYPNGGCCKECGSVEHFAKDCPTKAKKRQSHNVKLRTLKSAKSNVEDDDMMDLDQFMKVKKESKPPEPQKPKVVKF